MLFVAKLADTAITTVGVHRSISAVAGYGLIHTRKQRATRHEKKKKWSQVPFCCLLHHALFVACSVNNTVVKTRFVCPNLLRFSRRV